MSAVAAVTSSTQAAGTPTAAQLAALNSSTNAQGGQTTLGENDFLKLLTVQLQNQDPLQPMSDTDFISQMATFSSLSEMQTLNTNFSGFQQTQSTTSAASLLGQTVSVDGATGSATGTVTGVSVTGGNPQITINGTNYDLSDITSIAGAAAAASASTSSGGASASK
jgi:flagellar basal-body rod modification protein FlgD